MPGCIMIVAPHDVTMHMDSGTSYVDSYGGQVYDRNPGIEIEMKVNTQYGNVLMFHHECFLEVAGKEFMPHGAKIR